MPSWILSSVLPPGIAAAAQSRRVGGFEQLPKWLNCIPLLVQWGWLGLRYGSLTLPTCANPAITSGGMVGEGKMEYFATMGPLACSYVPATLAVKNDGTEVASRLNTAMLSFPLVAKPDIGWCGYGVRKVADIQALQQYLADFPAGETVVLQEYLPQRGEAGIFYMRQPGEKKGRIIGILLRYFPEVVGDGKHRVAELIAADVRLHRLAADPLHRAEYDPDHVPGIGEAVRLSLIGSTRVGGIYRDGTEAITALLNEKIDAIAQDMTEFHAGRFDIRYDTLSELSRGEGIRIMEVNGSGSEAVHAWDPDYSILQAYRIIFAKQRELFALSARMRARGFKPMGLWRLARLHFWQQGLIARYPLSN